jgi:putative copper export protein
MVEVAPKILTSAGVLLVVGASATFWFVLERETASHGQTPAHVYTSLRRIGVVASLLTVVGVIVRAWAHTAAVVGVAESWTPNALSMVVVESRWGHGWRWQLMASVACLVLFALATGTRRRLWAAAALAAVALVWSLTTTGHAAGVPARIVLHASHILGGGVWLGSLAALMLLKHGVEPQRRHRLFTLFSAVALTGAAAVAVTGAIASYLYIGSLSNLIATAYGRLLMVKLALVAAVTICGYLNWRSINGGFPEPGRLGIVELMAALAVVVATGLLTELEHP